VRRSAKAPGQRDVIFTRTIRVRARLVVGVWAATLCLGLGEANAQFRATEPPPADRATDAAAETENQQQFGLPPGLEPPGTPHASLSINDELITAEEIEAAHRQRLEFRQSMFEGDNSGKRADIIKQSIAASIKSLTLIENRPNLFSMRKTLMTQINSAAAGKVGLRAEQFRAFVLKEVVDNASLLLANNLQVRIQGALILSSLTLRPADPRRNLPPVAYAPAYAPLLDALLDPDQPMAVKVIAANGLGRTLMLADLRPQERQIISSGLIAQLADPTTIFWYQRSLVEGLGWSEVTVDEAGLPTVIQRLAEIMVDANRPWQVRAQAARSLGRVRLAGQIKVDLIAYEVAKLFLEMVQEFNENPKPSYWRECFYNTYVTFLADGRLEVQKQAGLLNKLTTAGVGQYRKIVEEAYHQLHPLIQHMAGAPRTAAFPAELIEPLETWLEENVPEDPRIHPALDPISSADPVSASDDDLDEVVKTAGRSDRLQP